MTRRFAAGWAAQSDSCLGRRSTAQFLKARGLAPGLILGIAVHRDATQSDVPDVADPVLVAGVSRGGRLPDGGPGRNLAPPIRRMARFGHWQVGVSCVFPYPGCV